METLLVEGKVRFIIIIIIISLFLEEYKLDLYVGWELQLFNLTILLYFQAQHTTCIYIYI